MISSNYVSLALNPKGSPPPPCVNKDNLSHLASVCHWFADEEAEEEPVHLSEVWGPSVQ